VGKTLRGSEGSGFEVAVDPGTLRKFVRRVGEVGRELGRDGARERAGVPGFETSSDDQMD
jgi:hypothetical protein